jgi:hypothetical protein
MTDPVWSIFIAMILLLSGTGYYIYTIMFLAYQELKEDGQVREQGQEGICEQQGAEPGQLNSKES